MRDMVKRALLDLSILIKSTELTIRQAEHIIQAFKNSPEFRKRCVKKLIELIEEESRKIK